MLSPSYYMQMSLEKNHSVFIFSVSGLIFCHYGYQDVSLTLMQKDYMVKNTSSFMDNQKIV